MFVLWLRRGWTPLEYQCWGSHGTQTHTPIPMPVRSLPALRDEARRGPLHVGFCKHPVDLRYFLSRSGYIQTRMKYQIRNGRWLRGSNLCFCAHKSGPLTIIQFLTPKRVTWNYLIGREWTRNSIKPLGAVPLCVKIHVVGQSLALSYPINIVNDDGL